MIYGHNVNKYYLRYGLFFIFGIIALIFVDYFQLKIPDLIGNMIDDFESSNVTFEIITSFLISMLIVAAVMFFGRFIWRICIFGNAQRIQSDLREEMFFHADKLSQRYYQENKTGALMALYTNDIETIADAFGGGTVMLVDALFLGSLSFIYMFRINWILALICTLPLICLALSGGIIGKTLDRKWDARQKAYEDLSDLSQENFSGISVIKAFVKEKRELDEFRKVNKNNVDKNIDFVKYSTLVDVFIGLFISLISVIIVAFGGYYVSTGSSMTVGELTKFISYFSTLTWPMMAIGQLINMHSQASASLKRINQLVDEKVEIVDNEVVNIEKIEGKIEYRHFSFSYPDSNIEVLHDITFTINKGEMIGIIGRTGSGKTTLVDSLLRLYNIPDENIFIDDNDIMHLPFKTVREAIGYVPQDNFLFSDTIKNNIMFANKYSDEEVRCATEFADVHDNIMEFKDGYNTVLGERGVTISGGQKQRVSIARAIIKDPEILILDDSVSAVDTKTEEKIISNLKRDRKGKTTILIAHRISTVKDLDKVLLIDEGRVVDYGRHDELISRTPLYREMVDLQKLEDEVEGK